MTQIGAETRKTNNWVVNDSDQDNVVSPYPYVGLDYFNKGGKRVATVWMTYKEDKGGSLYVPTISPPENNLKEKIDWHNRILQRFKAEIVDPVLEKSEKKYNVEFTKPLASVEDLLPTDLAKKLQQFNVAANRNGLHPADEKRWRTFIISVYRAKVELEPSQLRKLLVQDLKWPPARASKLVSEFENGLELLRDYDEI
jgi:hypothetical protein